MSGHDWPAPAKLNLFLLVTGRRDDGYHDLQTVFQLLDFSDRLDFSLRDDGLVYRRQGADEVAEEADLVVRAARLLQHSTGCRQGVDIMVEKHLPMGAGLGGGSSDAATTLMALNQLWKLGLEADELARIGLSLGADVPVFIHGHSAWAEGVGERLEPIRLDESVWYVVIRPPCGISTAAIFADPELTRASTPITIRAFLEGAGRNDCESVVRARYPEVDAALNWLGQFSPARLTGTGSCIFARFPGETEARQVLEQAPAIYTGFVARGVDESPLLARLTREQGH